MDLKKLLGLGGGSENKKRDQEHQPRFGLSGGDARDSFHLAAEAAARVSTPASDATLDPAAPENAQHLATGVDAPGVRGSNSLVGAKSRREKRRAEEEEEEVDDYGYLELDEDEEMI